MKHENTPDISGQPEVLTPERAALIKRSKELTRSIHDDLDIWVCEATLRAMSECDIFFRMRPRQPQAASQHTDIAQQPAPGIANSVGYKPPVSD